MQILLPEAVSVEADHSIAFTCITSTGLRSPHIATTPASAMAELTELKQLRVEWGGRWRSATEVGFFLLASGDLVPRLGREQSEEQNFLVWTHKSLWLYLLIVARFSNKVFISAQLENLSWTALWSHKSGCLVQVMLVIAISMNRQSRKCFRAGKAFSLMHPKRLKLHVGS